MNLEENIKALNKIRVKKNHELWIDYLQKVIELFKKEWGYNFYYDDKYNSICYKLNDVVLFFQINMVDMNIDTTPPLITVGHVVENGKGAATSIKDIPIKKFKMYFEQMIDMYNEVGLLCIHIKILKQLINDDEVYGSYDRFLEDLSKYCIINVKRMDHVKRVLEVGAKEHLPLYILEESLKESIEKNKEFGNRPVNIVFLNKDSSYKNTLKHFVKNITRVFDDYIAINMTKEENESLLTQDFLNFMQKSFDKEKDLKLLSEPMNFIFYDEDGNSYKNWFTEISKLHVNYFDKLFASDEEFPTTLNYFLFPSKKEMLEGFLDISEDY